MTKEESKNKSGRIAYILKIAIGTLWFVFVLLMLLATYVNARVEGALYMYSLSDFTGTIPYNWVGLSVDEQRDEVYVVYQNEIEIFNDKGMKVYKFGYDIDLGGVIHDVSVDRDGDIYMLSIDDNRYTVVHCNYRGEPRGEVQLKNVPRELMRGFLPSRIIYREGRLYLADLSGSKKIVVTDADGTYRDMYDIDAILNLDQFDVKAGHEKDIAGFSVDGKGNLLFTMPTIFKAFIVSPDREVRSFGEAGSIPGKFGVVAGIASDDNGNLFVVDTLKCVVIVFDRDLNFITEFGFRGTMPGNLIAPKSMVINDDKIYVSQSRKRGVNVYRIVSN